MGKPDEPMTDLKLTQPGWKHCTISGGNVSDANAKVGDIFLRGRIERRGRPLQVEDLRECLPALLEGSVTRRDMLAKFAGFFCMAIRTPEHTFAVVDRVRSMPLFYTGSTRRTVISDSAETLRELERFERFDATRVEEFEHTGYVTGAGTLFDGLDQLQAGECLVARHDRGTYELDRYWRFTHEERRSTIDSTNFDDELQRALAAVIERCLRYAKGRQIVLPLSGGYDSRLLATEFKRQKAPNLLAISYGETDSKELSIARRVADSLGIDWKGIVYSERDWKATSFDDERLAYQSFASNWCSLPHLQDWLAMKRLREENFFQPDCVFVPGHTGDFISGGHVPPAVFEQDQFSAAELKELILEKHYRLKIGMDANSNHIRNELDSVGWGMSEQSFSQSEAASLLEEWEWQERQAKYIVNSVRIYEFFGFDWWLPMWDVEFVEHWRKVPLALRRGKSRYNEFVMRHYDEHGTTQRQEGHASNKTKWGKRIAALGGSLVSKSVLERIRRERKVLKVKRGFLGYKGRFGELEWKKMLRRGIPINGLNIPLFLSETGRPFLVEGSDSRDGDAVRPSRSSPVG